jgi:hypothetical protein
MQNRKQEHHRVLRSLSSEGLGRVEDVNRGIGSFLSSPYHQALERIQTLKSQLFSNEYEYNELVGNESFRHLVIKHWDNFKNLDDNNFCFFMKLLISLNSKQLFALNNLRSEGLKRAMDCLRSGRLRRGIENLDSKQLEYVMTTILSRTTSSTDDNIRKANANIFSCNNKRALRDTLFGSVSTGLVGTFFGAVVGAVVGETILCAAIGLYAGGIGSFLMSRAISGSSTSRGFAAVLDGQRSSSQPSAGR